MGHLLLFKHVLNLIFSITFKKGNLTIFFLKLFTMLPKLAP